MSKAIKKTMNVLKLKYRVYGSLLIHYK